MNKLEKKFLNSLRIDGNTFNQKLDTPIYFTVFLFFVFRIYSYSLKSMLFNSPLFFSLYSLVNICISTILSILSLFHFSISPSTHIIFLVNFESVVYQMEFIFHLTSYVQKWVFFLLRVVSSSFFSMMVIYLFLYVSLSFLRCCNDYYNEA